MPSPPLLEKQSSRACQRKNRPTDIPQHPHHRGKRHAHRTGVHRDAHAMPLPAARGCTLLQGPSHACEAGRPLAGIDNIVSTPSQTWHFHSSPKKQRSMPVHALQMSSLSSGQRRHVVIANIPWRAKGADAPLQGRCTDLLPQGDAVTWSLRHHRPTDDHGAPERRGGLPHCVWEERG